MGEVWQMLLGGICLTLLGCMGCKYTSHRVVFWKNYFKFLVYFYNFKCYFIFCIVPFTLSFVIEAAPFTYLFFQQLCEGGRGLMGKSLLMDKA